MLFPKCVFKYNQLMNAMIEQINSTGKTFVEFSAAILIQSSLSIAIILFVDLLLRNQVRAIFRYCIWMLVLVKSNMGIYGGIKCISGI